MLGIKKSEVGKILSLVLKSSSNKKGEIPRSITVGTGSHRPSNVCVCSVRTHWQLLPLDWRDESWGPFLSYLLVSLTSIEKDFF